MIFSIYFVSLSKLETVLAQASGREWRGGGGGGYLNGEPQTLPLSCVSNAALLSLKLLLSAG